ncbi:bifunctional phosphopantothenoylcysteine decarboxylase/phosphopantothenate--cysteine ligase CoaBC [Patulibacter brassicae]|uniref:Coenzyme A biosynthesis bifunctional protein CoaBC n=1 Tax=Patulibacter brassicae TaxID=1705717 RepID=A0ABU4VE77_9ACTN|nr:bifunctional phosphopantothenoylcysteine decarboxylase/phosphopantothenate--cysteine ligase CoaBC [Patulibacter brassicae]MDX8150052.1 bifunctional phosphopantothenoylcysteine decarboxylase/phosphopantothenate--cysteine ligase CoaBC [Patulibacter brassicae]
MARLLLGVTGGIAAYKAVHLVRLATGAGHAVRVLQTPASQRFVAPETFRAITGAPVLVDEWQPDPLRGAFPGDPVPAHEPISHLAVVEAADAYVVAPATANTIAALAQGRADNLVTSAYLAADGPVLVAPAMNHRMWHHPATARNVAQLTQDGATIVPPGSGRLASIGESGDGRLAEPEQLLAAIEAALGRGRDLAGVRLLVSAGGTREPIDAVRYVGNRSSGRMGYAVAARAAARGAEVIVVAANVALPDPPGARVVRVGTAEELRQACGSAFAEADVLVMAAAVADFRPADPAGGKIKKDGREGLTIELESTVDVLRELSAARRPGQTLIGFAAEHGEGALEHARGKLRRKGLDGVVLNDVSQPGIAFDATDNAVTIVTAEDERVVARAAKEQIADAILDRVLELRAAAS